jgi:hypothetical protein
MMTMMMTTTMKIRSIGNKPYFFASSIVVEAGMASGWAGRGVVRIELFWLEGGMYEYERGDGAV